LDRERGAAAGPENIDIVAFTMVDLQHHGRTAAERPGIDVDLLGIDLTDQRAGNAKETCPIRAARTHDASG
jgi:hypothetical protein